MAIQSIPGAAYKDTMNTVQKSSAVSGQASRTIGTEQVAMNTTGDSRQTELQQNGMVNENQVKNAINHANEKLRFTRTRCEFTYHDEINRVAIKVIDRDTNEVIKEIPPEETLELVQKLWELAGIIIDEKR